MSPSARRPALLTTAGFAARLAAVLLVPTRPIDDFWSYFERVA